MSISVSEGAALPNRERQPILGVPIDVLGWDETVTRILKWADGRQSRVVCTCNVHSLITARRNRAHADALRTADLVTADGAPVAWLMRRKGFEAQQRISGPDLMWSCCREAAKLGIEMFFYGGTPTTLRRLEQKLCAEFPGIRIVGTFSPPFRLSSAEEDVAVTDIINHSGAKIVWVGLGCPKQEAWLHAHRGCVNAVMLGVGAAFDFHADVVKRAPAWLRQSGFEWLHRLWQEPRRLAGRYLVTNTIFIIAVLGDLLFAKAGSRDA